MKSRIVTLCGSTDFKEEYERVNRILTLQGNIILSCGVFRSDYPDIEKHRDTLQKVHRKKIDMSDGIVVINLGGYISPHTQEEIDYAKSKDKKIIYLENDGVKLF